MRLSFPDLKDRPDSLRTLCDAAIKLESVQRVEARPRTGSLIITHDGSSEDLVKAAKTGDLFTIKEAPESYGDGPRFEAQAWKTRADRFLKGTLGGGFDLPTVAALAFFAMALRQLAAGRIMPPAATALWYGLSLLLIRGASVSTTLGDGDGGE